MNNGVHVTHCNRFQAVICKRHTQRAPVVELERPAPESVQVRVLRPVRSVLVLVLVLHPVQVAYEPVDNFQEYTCAHAVLHACILDTAKTGTVQGFAHSIAP